jgi:hypothetical protein
MVIIVWISGKDKSGGRVRPLWPRLQKVLRPDPQNTLAARPPQNPLDKSNYIYHFRFDYELGVLYILCAWGNWHTDRQRSTTLFSTNLTLQSSMGKASFAIQDVPSRIHTIED